MNFSKLLFLSRSAGFCIEALSLKKKQNKKKQTKKKYISIDRRYLYCISTTYITSISEKESSAEVRLIHAENCLYRISSFYDKRIDTL